MRAPGHGRGGLLLTRGGPGRGRQEPDGPGGRLAAQLTFAGPILAGSLA